MGALRRLDGLSAIDAGTKGWLAIRATMENRTVRRDAGERERFAACRHEEGFMMAT